jgi:hypothetical protein
MKRKQHAILLVILTVVVLLMAVVAESVYFSDFEYRFRTRMFNKILIHETYSGKRGSSWIQYRK